MQRAAPATETKLSNDLQVMPAIRCLAWGGRSSDGLFTTCSIMPQTFAALLNKDLEEARRQRAAKMEEENSKMRERLSKVDGKLLPELRKARKERAEREREEAKKEVEAKKDALSSLKEELIDVQVGCGFKLVPGGVLFLLIR